MKEIIVWIVKHKVYTVLVVLLIFILPILSIIYVSSVMSSSFFSDIGISSDSLLTYVAGFEAFVGTVILGAIAVFQNDRSIDINNRLTSIEEASSLFQRYPNLKVDSLSIAKTNLEKLSESEIIIFWKQAFHDELESNPELEEDQLYHFSFLLKNVSDFNVTICVERLELQNLSDKKPSIAYDTEAVGVKSKFNVIAPTQSLILSFMMLNSDFDSITICNANMSIVVENNINEKFKCFLEFLLIINQCDNIFRVISERTTPLNYR